MKPNLEIMASDTSHWQSCEPPLSPNDYEVYLYKKLIGGKSPVCLLGLTKKLSQFSNLAVDIAPIEIGIPTLKCNWNNLNGRFGAIIGDGILNLEGLQIVDKMLSISDRFIVRVFTKKLAGMKYATIFPTEFPMAKCVIATQENIVIAMWDN